MNTGIDPAFPPMITFYSVAFFQLFDRIGLEAAREVAQAASDISCQHALQYECGKAITYDLPHVGKVSPGKVLAAMPAFLVWQQRGAGIDYLPDSVFLQAADDAYKLHKLNQNYE